MKSISHIIQAQGYIVIEFDPYDNEEDLSVIISRLDLADMISRRNGFTYADSEHRFVFVNKELNDEEKLLVLAHEAGHILCNHLEHAPILGRSVTEEDEANQFSHYLLHPRVTDILRIHANLFKKQICIAAILIAIAVGIIGYYFYEEKQASYYGEYYITENGEKYHRKDCMIIRERTNVRRLTIDEFESGEYSPCQICLPE